jgi:ribosomal protein L34
MMENPRNSNVKKRRKQGFRARMRTKEGRKILNRQRALKNGAKRRK